MSQESGASKPPRLRQVWPPVDPTLEPRLGYGRSAKLRKVRDVLGWRSMRAEVLGSRLLHDPAWDALLHIYAAELAGQDATLPELASALGTNRATVQRWVRALEEEGLVEVGPSSAIEPPVRLTDHGIGGMHALFELLPGRGSSHALSA